MVFVIGKTTNQCLKPMKQLILHSEMPKLLLLCVFTAMFPVIFAQHKKSGDTLILHKVKYTNGKLAAFSWMLQSTGNGRATCWDPQGKIQFDSEISRNHGHHSVQFEHHANKVVSRVEESSAPDAGIQWYRSTYYYDDKGVKTGENHDSYDDRPSIIVQDPQERPVQVVVPPPVISYNSEIWFINQTEFTLIASYTMKGETQADTLRSGDTLKMGSLTQPHAFENPTKSTTFSAATIKKTRRSDKWKFAFQASGEEKSTETDKRYYYVIGQQLAPKNKRK